jgi:NAD(P)H-hydrate repair Nnr-like enzyme with NAD(P)H-hydrate dehydratase domain
MLKSLHGRAVLTPHAGEMATLLGIDKTEVEANPADVAVEAAATFGAIVALKGAESWIASPDGELFHYRGGSIGLATSGSGDTLAGIVTGLTARCGDPLIATCWGVWAHGTAGTRLARRVGQVGFLARELLAEIPPLVGRA